MILKKINYEIVGETDKLNLEFETNNDIEKNRCTLDSIKIRLASFLNTPEEKILKDDCFDTIVNCININTLESINEIKELIVLLISREYEPDVKNQLMKAYDLLDKIK